MSLCVCVCMCVCVPVNKVLYLLRMCIIQTDILYYTVYFYALQMYRCTCTIIVLVFSCRRMYVYILSLTVANGINTSQQSIPAQYTYVCTLTLTNL